MSMLCKFIESLNVKFVSAGFREILSPYTIEGEAEKHNLLIMVNQGHIKAADIEGYLPVRSFYFIPAGKDVMMKYGIFPYDELGRANSNPEVLPAKYVRTVSSKEQLDRMSELITVVAFDVQLYDAIPFFEALDIPPFQMEANEELSFLVKHLAIEQECSKLGHEKIISNYMEEIMIHMCRYIESKEEFKPFIEKLDFLADRRLVDIVKYIRENLEKDLSNKTIANIAFISEDYVGQFFKSLTGKNLQDYIESQRLEKAMILLKTLPDNIQEIAHKVGFKDPAYFSRRFKMKYGANANSVRQNKTQLA